MVLNALNPEDGVVDTSLGTPAPADPNAPSKTTPSATEPNKDQEADDKPPELLSQAERDDLARQATENPDLKPHVDNILAKEKSMQGHWTKEMQAVPKKYRTAEAFKALLSDAELYGGIKANPAMVKALEEVTRGRTPGSVKPSEAKNLAEKAIEVMEQAQGPMSSQEKDHVRRFLPFWETIVSEKTKSLSDKSSTLEEEAAMKNLATHADFTGIDVAGFMPAIRELKKAHPNMPYRGLLTMAIDQTGLVGEDGKEYTSLAEFSSAQGAAKALKDTTAPPRATSVTGSEGERASDSGKHVAPDGKEYTQEEVDAMGAETFRKNFGIPHTDD